MYEIHYDYMENKYGDNSRLLFIDTDILVYEIKIEDVYEDFSKDKKMFDFSNYLIKAKFYDNSNKFVVGKMKNEAAGVAIEESFWLRPNLFLIENSSEH